MNGENRFESIYESEAARYWRDRRYVPPPCTDCPDVDVCAGACPLYWDAAGSFEEIPRARSANPVDRERWERERVAGRSFGVPCPREKATDAGLKLPIPELAGEP